MKPITSERAQRIYDQYTEEMSARNRRNDKGFEQVGGALFTLWMFGMGILVSVVLAAVAFGVVVLALT